MKKNNWDISNSLPHATAGGKYYCCSALNRVIVCRYNSTTAGREKFGRVFLAENPPALPFQDVAPKYVMDAGLG
jgi:hypothetical protein